MLNTRDTATARAILCLVFRSATVQLPANCRQNVISWACQYLAHHMLSLPVYTSPWMGCGPVAGVHLSLVASHDYLSGRTSVPTHPPLLRVCRIACTCLSQCPPPLPSSSCTCVCVWSHACMRMIWRMSPPPPHSGSGSTAAEAGRSQWHTPPRRSRNRAAAACTQVQRCGGTAFGGSGGHMGSLVTHLSITGSMRLSGSPFSVSQVRRKRGGGIRRYELLLWQVPRVQIR